MRHYRSTVGDYDTDAAARRCADAVLSSHEAARLSGIRLGLEAAARECERRATGYDRTGFVACRDLMDGAAHNIRALFPDVIAANREGRDG